LRASYCHEALNKNSPPIHSSTPFTIIKLIHPKHGACDLTIFNDSYSKQLRNGNNIVRSRPFGAQAVRRKTSKVHPHRTPFHRRKSCYITEFAIWLWKKHLPSNVEEGPRKQ